MHFTELFLYSEVYLYLCPLRLRSKHMSFLGGGGGRLQFFRLSGELLF